MQSISKYWILTYRDHNIFAMDAHDENLICMAQSQKIHRDCNIIFWRTNTCSAM